MFHTVFTVLTGTIVALGITRGIGRGVELMMPLLFLFILVLLGYSMASGDFNAAVEFMFIPDFSKLSTEAVLVAMGHAFFSLSLGMGAIMAYGAYMPQDASISKTILTVALLDTAFGLMMGLCIFPLIFANAMEPTSGPGLLFVSLPIAFATMPFGVLMGGLFFVLVLLAALTSSISLIEPGVAWLEKRKINRVSATVILCLIAWCGGMLCIGWSQVFDFLDALTSRYLLPLGGLAIAIFAGWIMQGEKLQKAVDMSERSYQCWRFLLRYISPLGIIFIFLHSFGLFA
jgi:NSS family neurotransmitter:Na+ symporter